MRVVWIIKSHQSRSDRPSRILWCIVGGESSLFDVITPANTSINQLKEQIHKKKENAFRDVDPNMLTLYKVSSFNQFLRFSLCILTEWLLTPNRSTLVSKVAINIFLATSNMRVLRAPKSWNHGRVLVESTFHHVPPCTRDKTSW